MLESTYPGWQRETLLQHLDLLLRKLRSHEIEEVSDHHLCLLEEIGYRLQGVEASPPPSPPETAMEQSMLTTLRIDVPRSARSATVEVSPDGSCVSVYWHFAPMER